MKKLIDLLRREKSSIIRSTISMLIVGAGTLVTRLTTLLSSILVARFTTPETFGAYTLYLAVFVIAAEVPKAFDASYIRHANDPSCNVSPGLYLFLALAGKVTLVLVVIVGILCVRLLLFGDSQRYFDLIASAVVSGLLFCVYTTIVAFYQRSKSHKNYSIFLSLPYFAVLLALLSMVCLNAKVTLNEVQLIYMAVAVIASCTGVYLTLRMINVSLSQWRHSCVSYFQIALILFATSLVSMVASRFDVFVLTNYLTFQEISVYGVGLRLAMLISVFTGIISVILYPKAPEVQKDKHRFGRYLGLSALYAIPPTAVAIVLIAWVDIFIRLLFGDDYDNATTRTTSVLLIVSMLLTSYAVPFQALIQSGRFPKIIMYLGFVRAVLTFGVLLVMVPIMNVIGAAMSMMIVSLIFLASLIIISMKICMPVNFPCLGCQNK